MLSPTHCQPQADNTQFRQAVDLECSPALHGLIDGAMCEVGLWLQQVTAVMAPPRIAPLDLPNPTPGRPVLRRVLDTSQALVIIARGQGSALAAHWTYVGLISQGFQGSWLGHAGFFVPGCGDCDAGGEAKARQITHELQTDGWIRVPPSRLPAGVRPRPGWFDDRVIAALAMPTIGPGWRPVPPRADRYASLPRDPALIRVGGVLTGLSGLVYAENARDEMAIARDLVVGGGRGGKSPVLTQRTYEPGLVNIRPSAVDELQVREAKPHHLPRTPGAVLLDGRVAIALNLKAIGGFTAEPVVPFAALPPGDGVLRLGDIDAAGRLLERAI